MDIALHRRGGLRSGTSAHASLVAVLALAACGAEPAPTPAVARMALARGCDCAAPGWDFVDHGSATAYNLRGKSLCIEEGTFIGTVELDGASSICVDDDATFLTAQALNLGGRIENHGITGSLALPLGFSAIADTVLDNHGAMYIGTANFNGASTITNAVDATIDFTTSFSLRNGSSMTNLGTFRAVSNFDTSGDSTFVNEGYGYITGQLSFEGISVNRGLLEITAKVNVNGTASFANTCTIVSHGTYNVNGAYLNDGLVYLHADSEDLIFNVTGGGAMTQGPEGQVFVTSLDGIGDPLNANLRVDGAITGQGLLYVEDETVCQGSGRVAGTAELPITLFDATPTSGQLCDIQSGILENVVRGTAPVVPTLARAQLGTIGSDCRTLGALHCFDDKPPDETDTGCDDTRPWCDTSREVRRCVACFEDSDCGGDRLCLDGACSNPDPLAVDDTLRVAEGGSVTVTAATLADNDSAVDVATLSLPGGVTSLVTAAGGTVTVGVGGFTYTPPAEPPASDVFSYSVCGLGTAAGTCVSADVEVIINRRPTPGHITVWVAVGTPEVEVDVLPAFADPDGDGPADDVGLEVVSVTTPDVPGVRTVSYVACDDGLPSACGAGEITVRVNDPPVLSDREVVGGKNKSIVVPLGDVIVGTGVVRGDDPSDGDSDGIGSVSVSGPCARDEAGNIVVTTGALPGTATCDVVVCEELPPGDARVCSSATITVRTAEAPSAVDDLYYGVQGLPVSGHVTTNDHIDVAGTATVVVLGPNPNPVTQGVVTVAGEFVTFTPVATFAGQVAVVYELRDGLGQVASATVTFVINDPPVLTNPSVELPPSGTTSIPLDDIIVGTGIVHGDDPGDGDTDGIGETAVITNPNLCVLDGDALDLSGPASFGRYTCQLRVCEERPASAPKACSTATITIIVPGADEPVAQDDVYFGAQGAPLGGDVSVNDTVDVVHGGVVGITVLGPTPNPTTEGVITVVGKLVTFTPVASFAGSLQVVYRLSDGLGQEDTATITFIVNDPPHLDDPTLDVPPGETVHVPVPDLVIDTGVVHGDDPDDGDDDGIGEVTVTDGACSIVGDDVVITTPAAVTSGPTTLTCTLRVCEEEPADAASVCAETTLTFVVPELLEATDDTVTTPEDMAVTIVVAANDDAGLHVTEIATGPAHGGAVIDESGTITYTPAPDFHGSDTFVYRTCSEAGACDTATVVVTVTPEPDAPVAVDDQATTTPNTAVTIDMLVNDRDADGDTLTVTAVTTPAHGTVGTDGVYHPTPGYRGEDTFDYTVCDAGGLCDTGTVTLTVGGDNQTPIGGDDSVEVGEDGTVTIPVLDNDGDPDGDDIEVGDVTDPEHGTAVVDEDGQITYTPDPDFEGEDSFTYEVCDSEGACADVTVTVTVSAVNDLPIAIDDAYTTPFETPITFDARDNDLDPDGDALTVTSFGQPASGTVALNAGVFTFTPADGMSGVVSFDYVVADPDGLSDDATVTITVAESVNGDPIARDDVFEVPAGGGTVIDVTANDEDPDGDALVVIAVVQPEHGTVTINEDGTLTYTPDPGFVGNDTFTYTVSDGHGGTATAVVTIVVEAGDEAEGLVAEGGGGCQGGATSWPALVLVALGLAWRGRAWRGRARRV